MNNIGFNKIFWVLVACLLVSGGPGLALPALTRLFTGNMVRPAKAAHSLSFLKEYFGAGDEIRTHDPNLGKVMLYP